MTFKSLFGVARATIAVWFAVGVTIIASADETFDGCTFYSRMKVAGNATTCPAIDVGYMPNGKTSLDARFRNFETTGTSCLFCSRDKAAGAGPNFTYFTMISGAKGRWDYNTTQKGSGVNPSLNSNYRLIIENGTAKLYTTLDRAPLDTMTVSASSFAATYRMYLFSSYANYTGFDNGGRFYFYYLKIYDGPIADGKLLHHYVPCKTSAGVVAVADLVEEKVYTSSQNANLLTVVETDSLGGVRPTLASEGFSARATFTASGYAGSETLEDFPVLVRLAENSPAGFSYGDCLADGSDLRFTDADGRLLAHEIDTWNSAGESLVWVNVPKLTKTTQFKMYLGGDGSVPKLPASSVWRRAGYHLVAHNNVVATESGWDSAGSGVSATSQSGTLVSASLAGAPLGKVDDQTGNDGWNVAKSSVWGGHGGQMTMSVWSYRTDTTDTSTRVLIGSKSNYVLTMVPSTSKTKLVIGSSAEQVCDKAMPVATGSWMMHSAVLNGVTNTVYQNGDYVAGKTISAAIADNTAQVFAIGSAAIGTRNKGYLDEVRLRWDSSTKNWVKAEYDTVANAKFLETDGVIILDPDTPAILNYAAIANTNGNILVSGTIKNHSAAVTVTLTAEGRAPVVISLGEIAAGDDFSREFGEEDGLVKFASYTVSTVAVNPDEPEKMSARSTQQPVRYGKVAMTDFSCRVDVTVPDGFTATPLVNFPLLVRLSTAISGFDYSQFQQSGKDLMAFDLDGNPLPCELESYDPEGESRFWVQVPVVSNGTRIVIAYGIGETVEPVGGMWSEYASVLHLNSEEVSDSTGNAVPSANAASVLAVGVLGKGRSMGTTSGKNGACVVVPVSTKLDECNGVFTASAWTKLNASPYWGYLMSRKVADSTAAWGLQFRGGSAGDATSLAFSTAGNSDGQSVIFKPLSAFALNAWVKWTAVFNGTELSLYTNGVKFATQTATYGEAVNGTQPLAIGGFVTSEKTATLPAVTDEARVKVGAVGPDWVAAEYKQETDALPLEYGPVGPADPNAPVIGEPVFTPNDDGTFAVTVIIEENMPKEGSVKVEYNGEIKALATSDVTVPARYAYTLTPAAADRTDVFTVMAKSILGGKRLRSVVFYSGGLRIEKVRDATEKGLSNGLWRITRADTTNRLSVALDRLSTSTAAVDVDYCDFPLSAVLEDGSNTVDIVLSPLMNFDRAEDTWVDLALSNGPYRVDSAAASARVTIKNYEIPVGGNIWCAAAPGKASDGANWTRGEAPDEYTAVVFDGDISTADCEWDVGAAHTVASWSQNARYTGTVTIDNSYNDTFPELVIKGDAIIGGGKWTHSGNYANFGAAVEKATAKIDRKYHIAVRVGGDFYLGAGASINVTRRGWGYDSASSGKAPCYGGWSDSRNWCLEPYGDYREPIDPGMGTRSQGDQNGTISAIGGGAVKLTVAGIANLEGDVLADGTVDKNIPRSTGTGGSVWIAAKQISGGGRISTSTCPKSGYLTSDYAVALGSGGRMALYTEQPLAKGLDKLFCSGVAYAETGSSKTMIAGPGTIFIKDSTMASGMLYIKQPASVTGLSNTGCSVPVIGDWTLDRILFSGAVQLRVLPGRRLTLPSLAAIESENLDSTKSALVIPYGASLDCGTGLQTLRRGVVLMTEDYVLSGDLVLEQGAKIGAPSSVYSSSSSQAVNYDRIFKLSVTGNVIIPQGASAGATRAVTYCGSVTSRYGAHGGQSLWSTLKGYGSENGYDSIVNPSMTGYSTSLGFFAGGAFTLEVGGTLTLDGTITSDGGNVRGNDSTYDGCAAGSAGTVNITAGSLSGSGSISANGGCGRSSYAGGSGGGRVAVRLTDKNATFASRWIPNINALGMSFTSGNNAKAASAGTVFLVDGTQTDSTGVVYVRNDIDLANAVDNQAFTCLPGTDSTCDSAEALRGTSLVLDGGAKVKLTDDLSGGMLKLINNTRLDLAGRAYTVRLAYVNGSKIPVGVYAPGDEAFGDLLVDSVGGGSLRITGYGLWVFVQ